jgi:hypothetical protein
MLVDGDEVLDVVGLLAGAAGGVDDDLQVRVGGLQAGLGLAGPPVHAAGPAVGGGRDRDADDVGLGEGDAERQGGDDGEDAEGAVHGASKGGSGDEVGAAARGRRGRRSLRAG